MLFIASCGIQVQHSNPAAKKSLYECFLLLFEGKIILKKNLHPHWVMDIVHKFEKNVFVPKSLKISIFFWALNDLENV